MLLLPRVPLRLPVIATLAVLALASSRLALAGIPVPDPAHSTIPDHVIVVGNDGVTPDPVGRSAVVVRDLIGHPIPNSVVQITFLGCSGIGICLNQLDPSLFMDCTRKSLQTVTDAFGVARFDIMGAASPVACPSDPSGCAVITADGVLLGHTSVAALDLDGAPGLSGTDLAEWLGGFACGSNSPRLDYDGDGVVGGDDLSLWLGAFFGARSAMGCSAGLCK
jgi:hypothetical protein